MPHLLHDLPHPAIIAHRGASRYAPENTLAAFQLAVEQGADGVELDVRLSADGHLVVIHDASISHTTNGRGRRWVHRVANMTLVGLRELDAGNGEKIPTLDEVFETLGRQLLINVELKPLLGMAVVGWAHPHSPSSSPNTQMLAEKVAHTVLRHALQEVVICSSFNPLALKALARCAPEIPRGLLLPAGFIPSRLAARYFVSALAGRTLTYQTLHPNYRDVLKGALLPVRQPGGPRVFTYTVNDEAEMVQLFKRGMDGSFPVDGIFTDDPLLARRVRGF